MVSVPVLLLIAVTVPLTSSASAVPARSVVATVRLAGLLLQEAGDGGAEGAVGDQVGAPGPDRGVAAVQLVGPLRAGFDARDAVRDRVVDRLVVAALEVEEAVLLEAAPEPAVEGVGAAQVEGGRDEL